MQFLSRIYGGKGGYTSEELYRIATGKKPKGGYYIYPLVKNAPPEVNRILQETYRRHRKKHEKLIREGKMTPQESKKIAAIAAWNAVRRRGYRRVMKLVPVWTRSK